MNENVRDMKELMMKMNEQTHRPQENVLQQQQQQQYRSSSHHHYQPYT